MNKIPPEVLIEMSPMRLDGLNRLKRTIDALVGIGEAKGATAPESTLGYHSHLLLGQINGGAAAVVMRWDRAPSQAEIDSRKAELPKVYSSFVLVRPCGPVLDGNG